MVRRVVLEVLVLENLLEGLGRRAKVSEGGRSRSKPVEAGRSRSKPVEALACMYSACEIGMRVSIETRRSMRSRTESRVVGRKY